MSEVPVSLNEKRAIGSDRKRSIMTEWRTLAMPTPELIAANVIVCTSTAGTTKSLYFFFSSRRRHTRYIGDWSSDVCSSDLHLVEVVLEGVRALGIVPEPV